MQLICRFVDPLESSDSHEAAIALGVIGSKEAKSVLEKALKDPELSVVESAVVALSNIEFMEKLSKNEKFAKLTGG